MTHLDIRRPMADLPIENFPFVELKPIRDTWADGIVDPVEIIGHGSNFRVTFFALMKLDDRWIRVPVARIVRATVAYRRNQLGDMLAKQKAESRLIVH